MAMRKERKESLDRAELMAVLWSYKNNYDKEIKTANKIESLRTAKMSLSVSLDGMPGGNTHSSMEDYIVKLTTLEAEQAYYASEKLIAYSQVTDLINRLEDEIEKTIIYERYISWRPWLDIADELGYSYGRIRNKHTEVLNKLIDQLEAGNNKGH